jgi:DNA-binding LacI/PurR family transcriptional regulator
MSPAFRDWTAGCHQRAAQLGYRLDPFSLHDPALTPARLAGLLESRNIRGLIISPLLDRAGLPDGLDLISQRFACVVVGLRPAWPPLNFTTNDQFSTAFRAVQRLWKDRYRRIGLVLSPELDAAVDHRFSAGFWAAHQTIACSERLPPFPFHPAGDASFRSWYAGHRPDVILTIHDQVKEWIAGMRLRVPAQVGLAHLDLHHGLPDWSGMNQNNTLVGAAAIDMLIGQLHRNETGLPASPKASFIQSTWIEGPSTQRIEGQRPVTA